jgi:hypothetical protein
MWRRQKGHEPTTENLGPAYVSRFPSGRPSSSAPTALTNRFRLSARPCHRGPPGAERRRDQSKAAGRQCFGSEPARPGHRGITHGGKEVDEGTHENSFPGNLATYGKDSDHVQKS